MALGYLCSLFGFTRQSYYQHYWQQQDQSVETHLIVRQVRAIRSNHPRMGGRKLYELLEPFMLEHQIKMGRDALFDLLATEGLLVKRRKRKIYTTMSYHRFHKYPNQIKTLELSHVNQLWVSDITYWKIDNGHVYISFITDAYSHKIVGYHAGQTLEVAESIQALGMALSGLDGGPESHTKLIHHSDRGIQYCSNQYVKLLNDNAIQISMTENGDPLDNSIAERINGIIKNEYLDCYQVQNLQEAQKLLEQVVKLYNEERPHMSIGNKTPSIVHQTNQKTQRLWKNYWNKNPIIVNQ
jgi:transposase InsO family protein